MLIWHGWPKLAGGLETWEKLGGAMGYLGVSLFPFVWGFLAALSETLGGALLVVGFLTRHAALALTATMVVATVMVYHTTQGNFREWSHPAEVGIACFAIFLMGAGRWSVDRA
jgi:putative oxidoreductase